MVLGVRVGRARWNHPADGVWYSRLRLPWETLVSLIATASAAALTCWFLFNYYGYFLGVFGSLCGAVLGAVLGAVWEPLSADWNAWWSEFNRRRRSRRAVTSILIVACSLIAGRAVDAKPVDAEPARRALVIGIATYVELAELKEAAGDAMKIADALAREESGFVVTSIIDADTEAEALRRGVKTFVASINPGDAVVIYYAGHGVQASGTNYLLPADFPKNPGRLKTHAIDIKALLKDVEARQPLVKILVLDACRNNPFAGSETPGLAQMDSDDYGTNTHIEFAAAANKSAGDGQFATHFAKELVRKGANLDEVFRKTRGEVSKASNGLQTTFSTSRMEINFYFVSAALPDEASALTTLERAAAMLPRGDVGQTAAVEALIRARRSLAGTELLQGLSLAKGTFDDGDFSEARLIGTDLSGAMLRASKLTRANLSFAVSRSHQH